MAAQPSVLYPPQDAHTQPGYPPAAQQGYDTQPPAYEFEQKAAYPPQPGYLQPPTAATDSVCYNEYTCMHGQFGTLKINVTSS